MTQWTRLGPRERELLAVLRRADDPLMARNMLDAVEGRGDDVAYTTVKRTVDRLVEKEFVERESERYRGGTRHRYRFDVEAAREQLIPEFVDELRTVLGESAVVGVAEFIPPLLGAYEIANISGVAWFGPGGYLAGTGFLLLLVAFLLRGSRVAVGEVPGAVRDRLSGGDGESDGGSEEFGQSAEEPPAEVR